MPKNKVMLKKLFLKKKQKRTKRKKLGSSSIEKELILKTKKAFKNLKKTIQQKKIIL